MEAVATDSFVGRYRPLLELGRGGMARVYLAESRASGLRRKLVVCKVLNQELANDPEMRQAFLREAEISSRLNHPNIVNVDEVFEHGQTAVMVMQYLEGLPLSEILSRLKGTIPLKLHLHIVCQVLDALHYFHELKDADGHSLECVHRDVSPDNVMVLHEGGIKVVDFGVAKVREHSENQTRAGVIKGKVAYMPPEQLLACANVDRRADIYSVGVMLWEAVAGRRMWRGKDASERMRAIIKGEVPDIRQAVPGVSDALVTIIERALAHAPDGRFSTAEEMQIQLEHVTLAETGHYLPRELADFMRTNFGEERRAKQRAVEKAAGDREYTLAGATLLSGAPTTAAEQSVIQRSSTSSSLTAAPVVAAAPSVVLTTPSRSRRPLLGAALVAAACGVGAIVALTRSEQPHATPLQATHATEALVKLRVTSDEPGAEVYVDGVKVGVTPFIQTRPASAQETTVELRAAGRVVQSKVVRLQDDAEVNFAAPVEEPRLPESEAVRADSPAPDAVQQRAAEVQAPGSESERRPAATVKRRPLTRAAEATRDKPAARGETAPPGAAKASEDESCNPPYRLEAGGVKVFKPQCL